MARDTNRRTLLGTAALALLIATPLAANSGEMHGTVTYAGGAEIPEGQLVISSEGEMGASAPTRIESDGKSTEMAFVLPAAASRDGQIEARLERADGWLLARGSASAVSGSAVTIELFDAMY